MLHRVFAGEESGYDKEIIDHFKATLKMWKDDVVSENAHFYVLVLPDEQTRKLALALGIKDYIQLQGNEFFEELSGKPWRFQYDGHWNEYGNLAGTLTIIESMKSLTPLKISWTSYDHIIKKHIQKIDEQYGLVKPTKGL